MHPHTLSLAFEDHLLVSSTLADEVEQLPQALGSMHRHDVGRLTCDVLAVLYATDGLINVPASEARGYLDRLAESLTYAVEVVHKSQEVALLRCVGRVVLSEAHGRLASCQLLEGEILTHSLYSTFARLRTSLSAFASSLASSCVCLALFLIEFVSCLGRFSQTLQHSVTTAPIEAKTVR